MDMISSWSEFICSMIGCRESVRLLGNEVCPRCGRPANGYVDMDLLQFQKRYWNKERQ